MKKNVWFGGLLALTMGIFLWCPMVQAAEIPAGVSVGGQDLGGLTREEAEQKIRDYIKTMEEQKITLQIGNTAAEAAAKDLGFYWSNEELILLAMNRVTEGNLLKRYIAMREMEQNDAGLDLTTAVDNAKVEEFVAANSSGLEGGARDATIIRENGQFIITPEQNGITVDTGATTMALNEALKAGLASPITVEAVITESEPRIREEDLATIQDVLGTFTTDFSSSGASRSKNLEVGSSKINGHVLMPGETLSGYECMQPFTKANGYATAAAYSGGQVIDSIGGGVCQIATTLYNMALRAELEITQRQNHSMIVTYVKPSMDAAIAGTVKDIKITNNYSTPIYIEGYTQGRQLTFTCYGKETRPSNREIEFISETLGRTDPGAPIEQVDPSLAPGARRRVQSSHTGLRSRLWKVVKVDGEETERTLLSTDTYNASKAIILVGPPAPEPVPIQEQPQPAETQPQPSQPSENIAGPGGAMDQPSQPQPPVQETSPSQSQPSAAEPPSPQPPQPPAPSEQPPAPPAPEGNTGEGTA
ncbi:VanW family protein [Lachnospiraceae bacterium 62-35]